MMNEATNAVGTQMRKAALADGYCTREIGTLFVRVTRHGCNWALELCDEIPIDGATARTWGAALSVPPDTIWRTTAHDKVWRCAWTGTEDAAPEGTKAFWLGGAA